MSQQYASQQAPGFKNHIENIAIVGAGGNVGKYITEALNNTGKFKIKAITRPESKSQIPSGVTAEKVDYSTDDVSALVNVLHGQDALIITMGVLAQNDPQKRIIQAAIEAKVPWIMTNEFGPDGMDVKFGEDVLLGPRQKVYRDMVEQSGVSSWVDLACGFWYEYSLVGGPSRYGFDFKEKSVLFYGDGDMKISTSTWPQTGRGVASLLSLKVLPEDANDDATRTLSHFKNRYAYISSFKVSQRDMFESVLRVTNAKAEDWKVRSRPAEEVYEESKKIVFSGDRSAFASMLYSRAFFPGMGMNWEHKSNNDVLGLQKEDLDEYTKRAIAMDASAWSS